MFVLASVLHQTLPNLHDVHLQSIEWLLFEVNCALSFLLFVSSVLVVSELADFTVKHVIFKVDLLKWKTITQTELFVAQSLRQVKLAVNESKNVGV